MRFLELIFLGLLALLLFRFVKGGKRGPSVAFRRCPHCGQQAPAIGAFCPICGLRIEGS